MALVPIDKHDGDVNNAGRQVAAWKNIAVSSTFELFKGLDLPDKTFQIYGTFGGASISVVDDQGIILNDPQGNPLTFTAAGCKLIAENTLYIRPALTGGDGTTLLTATLFCVGPRR